MRLDVRFPIGGMFAIVGAVLVVYGLLTPASLYQRSLGINVNLWWGIVLFVFGVLMLVFAYRAFKAERQIEK